MAPRTPFDPAQADRVIRRILDGVMLRDIWRDPTLPTRYTLKAWRESRPQFEHDLRMAVNAARSERCKAGSRYGPHTRAEIVARIRAGQTWRAIEALPHMPNHATIIGWLQSDRGFAWGVACAREEWMDELTDRVAPLLGGLAADDARAGLAARPGLLDLRRAPQAYGVDLLLRDKPHNLVYPLKRYARMIDRRHAARRRRWRKRAQVRCDEILRQLEAEYGAGRVQVVKRRPPPSA
jgi:hypothetical protein